MTAKKLDENQYKIPVISKQIVDSLGEFMKIMEDLKVKTLGLGFWE